MSNLSQIPYVGFLINYSVDYLPTGIDIDIETKIQLMKLSDLYSIFSILYDETSGIWMSIGFRPDMNFAIFEQERISHSMERKIPTEIISIITSFIPIKNYMNMNTPSRGCRHCGGCHGRLYKGIDFIYGRNPMNITMIPLSFTINQNTNLALSLEESRPTYQALIFDDIPGGFVREAIDTRSLLYHGRHFNSQYTFDLTPTTTQPTYHVNLDNSRPVGYATYRRRQKSMNITNRIQANIDNRRNRRMFNTHNNHNRRLNNRY
jgi:hypothetical protein